MSSTVVTNQSKVIYPAGINLATATIKCALFTSAETGLGAAATTYSSLTGEVTVGSGYTTGGNAITGLAWTGTINPIITGTITAWPISTFTFRYAVIYDVTTGKILAYSDFGSDQVVSAQTLTLSFDTNGFIKVTSS